MRALDLAGKHSVEVPNSKRGRDNRQNSLHERKIFPDEDPETLSGISNP
jgi:hypothetical protein